MAGFPLRFGVLYFGLYALVTQLAGGVLLWPGAALPPLGHVWPLRDLTLWLATNVAGLSPPLAFTGNSGDTAFHWVQTGVGAAGGRSPGRGLDRGQAAARR